MKKLKNTAEDFFKSFDCFTSPVNLRLDKEPQYDTLTGGCISLGLIILLISIFYQTFFDVINKNAIITSTAYIRETDPSKLITTTNQFMFGVGVNGINLSSNQTRYFDIVLESYYRGKDKITRSNKIPLSRCNVSQWQNFGQQFTETFNRFSLDTFVCPPENFTWHLEGKYTSPEFAYLKLTFKSCTGTDCKNASQFNSFIASKKAFYWNFYYANTLLNPEQKVPIQSVFQDKDYLMVSDKLGIDKNLYVSQYSISTDNSLYPTKQMELTEGIIINKDQTEQWSYIPNDGVYSKIYIRKSDNKIQIDRSFRKMDDMLSYVGGLFGLLAAGIGLVLKFYSQCSLELNIGDSLFEYDLVEDQSKDDSIKPKTQQNDNIQQIDKKEKQEMKLSNFNFLSYLIYLVYLVLKKLGFQPKWKETVMYDETIDETRNQLDVNTLLQKLVFYDKAIHSLFDENQLKLLYLQEKFKIHEIKKQREMLNLGNEVFNLFETEIIPQILLANMMTQENNTNHQLNNLGGFLSQFAQDNTSNVRITNNQDQYPKEKEKEKGKRVSIINQFTHQRKSTMGRLIKSKFSSPVKKEKNEIPDEITKAMDSLQVKIAGGDLISKRIFQGLQPELVKIYEQKSKDNVQMRKSKKNTRKKKQSQIQSVQSIIIF